MRIDENTTLHHVGIPLKHRDAVYHYSVRTGEQRSADATFKAYPTDVLRVAVVADWQGKPDLSVIVKDDVHLLLTAGDNIASIWQTCGEGQKDCVKPYAALIDAYPELFRRGACCITGFGYYAERAEVDEFPYYNTSLSGKGNQYPDPHSKFLAGEDSYILLTVRRGGLMTVEVKSLKNTVLDRRDFKPAKQKAFR